MSASPRDDAARPQTNGSATDTVSYRLCLNGQQREVHDAWLGESLLYVLRERLGAYGSKNACEQGECGACSVLLDGVLVCACCVLGADAADSEVTTIEGLAPEGALTDVQRHLVEAGGVQCGFCTPGFVMAIHDLLERRPDADALEVREAVSGNLCRCTGYGRIFAAVGNVQRERRHAGT
jgi:carbon-monoxide dehydrogenase small subunit